METSTSQLQQLLGRMDLTIEQPCRGVQQMFLAVRIQGYVNILFIISVLHPWYGIRWVVINNNNRLAELQSSVSIVPFLCFHFFVLSSPITITFCWSLPNLRPSSCPTPFLRFRIRFLMWILFSWSGLYFWSRLLCNAFRLGFFFEEEVLRMLSFSWQLASPSLRIWTFWTGKFPWQVHPLLEQMV